MELEFQSLSEELLPLNNNEIALYTAIPL